MPCDDGMSNIRLSWGPLSFLLTQYATNSRKHSTPGDPKAERGFVGKLGGWGSGHIMLSLDQPKEAMSLIIHWVSVVYIREEGEGIGGGLSTATEDSLWKMAQLASQDGDVIRV